MGRPLAVILVLLLAACGASQPSAPAPPPPAAEPAENSLVQCSAPRPQVCTMEYDPVCAQLAGGAVSIYSSPCNACADDSVAGYLPGACADE